MLRSQAAQYECYEERLERPFRQDIYAELYFGGRVEPLQQVICCLSARIYRLPFASKLFPGFVLKNLNIAVDCCNKSLIFMPFTHENQAFGVANLTF
jgi:hypothetical protein